MEVPNDPYHGYDNVRSCSCENCSTSAANPMFFEYFETSSGKAGRSDTLVLISIFVVAAVLFCIITNVTAPK